MSQKDLLRMVEENADSDYCDENTKRQLYYLGLSLEEK